LGSFRKEKKNSKNELKVKDHVGGSTVGSKNGSKEDSSN
jgi:hypothetical protein